MKERTELHAWLTFATRSPRKESGNVSRFRLRSLSYVLSSDGNDGSLSRVEVIM